ncbi:MAG TPA: AI-2E family transporter [Thermoanaerobaculia bacterium]
MTPAPSAAIHEQPHSARSGALFVVASAAAVALLYYGRVLFVTLAFALFLAFAMRPFVSLLERAGVPRVLAILLLIFLLVGGVVLLVINVTAQFNDLYVQMPRYQVRIRELVSNVMNFVDRIRARMGTILPEDARGVREVKISESPLETTRAFMARIGATLHFLLYAAAVPFLTFFMLKDREKFGRVIEGMFARSQRFGGSDVTGAVSAKMTSYALGLSFVMLIMASATTVALMVLRVNYYYLLGPLAGLAILVPYVGVLFSTIPAVAVAFFQYGASKAVIVFIVYTGLQFLEGNVLTPFIVGGKVRLFPLTILVAFIFWGLLWGIAGAMLAVPMTSAMKVVCEHVAGWEGVARLLGDPDPPPRTPARRPGL